MTLVGKVITVCAFISSASGYAVLPSPSPRSTTSLHMVDQNVLLGAAVGVGGLAFGIGLVAFTEQQGERAKERGGGLSESMSTRIAGGLLEDVEVSSVDDLGSLTAQLENALRQTGKTGESFEVSEEAKRKALEDADDGW
ncbi:hypothetical protein FisN_12Lh322 [Fistulifera solaris]|uniref:Uncharacterized protein n=1 Tax=Fistulifera solaris TaxID=1519565 RepID=A0A1Z5JLT8_FISSO|nr:hypothetical protein FisN_12Lh322 [Fistulifera solaris]|eukprot:GAX14983.1 hypothetical protein FisN_12Lh322 [Fistulifera solaris]